MGCGVPRRRQGCRGHRARSPVAGEDAFQVESADAAHHLASVTLVAGYDSSNRGFNFDGYGRGELAYHSAAWTRPPDLVAEHLLEAVEKILWAGHDR